MSVKQAIYKDKDTIEEMLKNLRLLDMSHNFEDQIKMAVEKNLSHREFLENLLNVERLGKKERLKDRNIKAARFEKILTLEEFDFSFQKSISVKKQA